MKLYTFYTDTHKEFYNKYFLPSFNNFNEFQIIAKKYEQKGNGMCSTFGFNQLMVTKMDIMINAIQENKGSIFVYMDCDIHIFGNIKEECIKYLGNKDLLFQTNHRNTINAGIIFCKANNKTLNFFKRVKSIMLRNPKNITPDQDVINDTISKSLYNLLPYDKYIGGAKVLKNGKDGKINKYFIPPNKNIKLHHSTCIFGVPNKLVQMEWVKLCMDKYKKDETNFPKWDGIRPDRNKHFWIWNKC